MVCTLHKTEKLRRINTYRAVDYKMSSSSKDMSRRSSRLESTGYYDPEGEPQISYKEKLCRIFKKNNRPRKQRRNSDSDTHSIESLDININCSLYVSGNANSDTSQPGNTNSGRNSPRHNLNSDISRSIDQSIYDNMHTHRTINTDRSANSYRNSSVERAAKIDRNSKDRKSQNPTMFNLKNFVILFFGLSLCSGLVFFFGTPRDNLQETQHLSPPTNKDINAAYEDMAEQLRHVLDELHRLKTDMKFLRPMANTLPDFALYSQGARVVHHLTSKTYAEAEKTATFYGIPIWPLLVNPSCVLQGRSELIPGSCWAFKGGQGHLLISLSHPAVISHVTLGHIPKAVSPNLAISSAPKEFTIYGTESEDGTETKLGRFLYDEDGDQLQTFKVPSLEDRVFKYVKLQVENNWGNPEYTCLYSFKVHGRIAELRP